MRRSKRRTGFTLLEVLLASLIAIFLLSGLYFAMDVTLRQTQEARDTVDVENLSSGVINRMNIDLSASLAPLPPKSGGNSASSSSSLSGALAGTGDPSALVASAAAATGLATTSPSAAPSASAPASSGAATGSTDPTMAAVPPPADIGFQSGILGNDKQLTVFASRLPDMLMSSSGLALPPATGSQQPSDLVRITYWLNQNGGGLCRQERPWVTADGVRDSAEPDLSTEASDVLAQEITDLSFSYFDGQDWQSEWNPDGSSMSPDGVTPLGPPRAVKVSLTFSIPGPRPNDPPLVTTIEQVIPVRAAPGTNTPTMIVPSTDPGTVTPDGSSSGTSGTSASTGTATGGTATGGTATGGAAASGTTPGGAASSGARPTGGASMPAGGARPVSMPSGASGGRGGGR